jgi:hypothetical protein
MKPGAPHRAPLSLLLLLAAIGFGLQLMYPIVTLRLLDLCPDARGAAGLMWWLAQRYRAAHVQLHG